MRGLRSVIQEDGRVTVLTVLFKNSAQESEEKLHYKNMSPADVSTLFENFVKAVHSEGKLDLPLEESLARARNVAVKGGMLLYPE